MGTQGAEPALVIVAPENLHIVCNQPPHPSALKQVMEPYSDLHLSSPLPKFTSL